MFSFLFHGCFIFAGPQPRLNPPGMVTRFQPPAQGNHIVFLRGSSLQIPQPFSPCVEIRAAPRRRQFGGRTGGHPKKVCQNPRAGHRIGKGFGQGREKHHNT
jgi:hypothetical protein